MKALRKEVISFLELVHQRELLLKQMHMAVESIQTDAFFLSEEDLEAKKAYAMESDKAKIMSEINSQMNPRQEMLQMGNNLVDLTD